MDGLSQNLDVAEEVTGSGGRYATERDGHLAEMTYSRVNEKLIIIDHTDVPDVLCGKGAGQALATTRSWRSARAGG